MEIVSARDTTDDRRNARSVPQVSCLLDRLLKRTDYVLTAELELSVLVCPPVEVLTERATSDSHDIAVDEVVFQEIRQNLCNASRHLSNLVNLEGYANALGIPPIL